MTRGRKQKPIPWLPKRGQWFEAYVRSHPHRCNPMRCVDLKFMGNEWFVYADRRWAQIMASRYDFRLPSSVWRFEPAERKEVPME